jgi:hypothetical protein
MLVSILRRIAAAIAKPNRPAPPEFIFPVELDEEDRRIVQFVIDHELSMTTPVRLCTTAMACRYVASAGIEGDFVECGVWRGGHGIIAAEILGRRAHPATVYLFDTFAGMTEPTERDAQRRTGQLAQVEYERYRRDDGRNDWCYASLEEVRENFARAGTLRQDKVRFIKGDVVQTLSREENLPQKISVLRLDTDWYESTKKELEVLWPRVTPGGVLILDDYGYWEGARKAVDEYFESRRRPFLQYLDNDSRVGVKL